MNSCKEPHLDMSPKSFTMATTWRCSAATLSWHASKYKVHKLHLSYTLL